MALGFGDHGEYYLYLGRQFGLSGKTVFACIEAALDATQHYGERVMALESVPIAQRLQLLDIAEVETGNLQRAITSHAVM